MKSKMDMMYVSNLTRESYVRKKDIREYRDSVKIGEKLIGPRDTRPVVLAKYRYFAITTDGCLQWIDLYMCNVRKVDSTSTDYRYFYTANEEE